MIVDTHCHIHEATFPLDIKEVLKNAAAADVDKMICVGTSQVSSAEAVLFADRHDGVYASIGVHPHDTIEGWQSVLDMKTTPKVVAIGEIGLDYYYTHSPRDVQKQALREQLQLAVDNDLPVIFHVRDAGAIEPGKSVWDDFWPIFDSFEGIRGELHSFTDTKENLQKGLDRGLYIGVNGISTFTKDVAQQDMFASIPVDRLLFETDAPFLTPVPLRGKVNEPAFVRNVALFHAEARNMTLDEIAAATTTNAHALFAI